MGANCPCGMSHEHEGARGGCRECGTAVCRSCSLEADHNIYCRWCAVTLAHAPAA